MLRKVDYFNVQYKYMWLNFLNIASIKKKLKIKETPFKIWSSGKTLDRLVLMSIFVIRNLFGNCFMFWYLQIFHSEFSNGVWNQYSLSLKLKLDFVMTKDFIFCLCGMKWQLYKAFKSFSIGDVFLYICEHLF